MTASFQTLNVLSALLPLVLLTALLPLMARSRRGIVFGVTLPLDAATSTTVAAAINQYRRSLLTLGIALSLVVAALAATQHPFAAEIVSPAATFFLLAAAIYLRVKAARQLRPPAADVPLERIADLTTPSNSTPLLLAASAILPLIASALWLRAHWSQIPARYPEHWNAAGQVNGWGTRSFASLSLSYILGAIIVVVLLAIAAFNAYAPGTGLTQRSRITAPLAAVTWIIATTLSLCGLMPLLRPSTLFVGLGCSLVATFAAVLWMVYRLVITNPAAAEPYDGTPDAYWRGGGMIYNNPADPALLVPKRFGMGWTLNFGRPASWVFSAALLLLIAGSCIVPLFLHK